MGILMRTRQNDWNFFTAEALRMQCDSPLLNLHFSAPLRLRGYLFYMPVLSRKPLEKFLLFIRQYDQLAADESMR